MLDIKKIRYPELTNLINLRPNPEIILGKEIFWQEKRDGSNLGVFLDDNNEVHLRSRNMDEASADFYTLFNSTKEAENVKELLISQKTEWGDDSVIFGELLAKGKSPTRKEHHEDNSFVVFDIWSSKMDGFLSYVLVHQHCYHFKLPVVELYGTCSYLRLKSLLKFRDKMLITAEAKGREGVVGKTYAGNVRDIFFKEKLDTPKLEKFPRVIEEGKVELPTLPDSEILGALNKVQVDIGFEKFKDVSVAMPLFAKYVSDECRKHNCVNRNKLFDYYKAELEKK